MLSLLSCHQGSANDTAETSYYVSDLRNAVTDKDHRVDLLPEIYKRNKDERDGNIASAYA